MASMLTAETAAKNNNENMTLHELFMNGKQIYLQIENGQTNITAKECAIKFEICNRKIRQQGIFSNNERVDDVKTNDLKYLLSHAYLGKLYGEKKYHKLVDKKCIYASKIFGKNAIVNQKCKIN